MTGGRRRRTVQLRHFGPADTKGDAVTILPAERIVAAGDTIVETVPYGFGSYPANWVGVLKRIKMAALEAATQFARGSAMKSQFSARSLKGSKGARRSL